MAAECILVMPVYNEAGCIGRVCREWLDELQLPGHVLLVVDDGSSDETPAILDRLTREFPALIVVSQPNGGHGSAVLHGYREALRAGCEWIFQVDSDGQFRPHDFHELWSRRHLSEFILGFRAQRKDPRYRRILSRLHRLLLVLLFGAAPQDPNVPYRLMRARLLERMLRSLPPKVFAPNVFLALCATRMGQPSLDVPVQHLPRVQGNSSIRWKTAGVALICLGELLRFRITGFRAVGNPSSNPLPQAAPPERVTARRP